MILLELDGTAVPAAALLVRHVKAEFPTTYIVGCCQMSASACNVIVDAVREGLDDLAIAGYADVADTVSTAMARRAAMPALTELRNLLRGRLHRVAAPVAEIVVTQAPVGPNVDFVARALGCAPRTLARRFTENGLGPPGRLVTLLRWMSVAKELTVEGRSAGEVAVGAGYASPRAMRAALKRRLNVALAQLRDADFFLVLYEQVLDAYGHHDGGGSPS